MLLISIVFTSYGEDFDLFENKTKENIRLYNTLKPHKFRVQSGGMFQGSEIYGYTSFSYNYFYKKKFALMFGLSSRLDSGDIDDLMEIKGGLTYRFTKRTQDLVFLGDLGVSANKYLETNSDFSLNHGFVGLSCEYTWKNGLGVDITTNAYMPFKFSVDENIIIQTGVTFIYQFK